MMTWLAADQSTVSSLPALGSIVYLRHRGFSRNPFDRAYRNARQASYLSLGMTRLQQDFDFVSF
jgi:hypothetical protein